MVGKAVSLPAVGQHLLSPLDPEEWTPAQWEAFDRDVIHSVTTVTTAWS
jgi:hypothetical protein